MRFSANNDLAGPLDFDNHDSKQQIKLLEQLEFIRKLLRWEPTWIAGHLSCARVALNLEQISRAFGSAYAIQVLAAEDSPMQRVASLLKARCYLKRGGSSRAEKILRELIKSKPDDWEAREELGAALMGLGQFSEAYQELKAIPEEMRNAEAAAALKYLMQHAQ